MSAQPLPESPPDAAAGDVLRAVGAARRRVRTVATLRLIAIAAPAGVTAGAAVVIAGWAPAETPRVLGVLGAVAATAWAAARTPPLAAVARILDARLGLRDRVAAAVQLQTTGGPIAALVARDAAARLTSVRMSTVFPLAMGRMPAVAIALAIASTAWLISGRVDTPAEALARRAASNSAGAGEAGSRTPGGARGVTTDAAPRTSRQAAAPRAAASRTLDGRGNDATRGAFASAATSRRPQDAQPSVAPTPGSSVNTAGASRQTAAAPAAGAIGRTGRGGSGAGSASNGEITAGAGGASPGNVLASAGSNPVAPVASVSFRTARANAAAALARDVIPPDYRDHVRAYFNTLSPPYTGAAGTR